jgi:hypothetical protein
MRFRSTKSGLISALAFGALFGGTAQALRCDHRLISVGDHESKLLRYCGEPISIDSRLAPRIYVDDAGRRFIPGFIEYVEVEEWTYNFGPRKLMRRIRIEDGIVAEIRHLGYGFLEK